MVMQLPTDLSEGAALPKDTLACVEPLLSPVLEASDWHKDA